MKECVDYTLIKSEHGLDLHIIDYEMADEFEDFLVEKCDISLSCSFPDSGMIFYFGHEFSLDKVQSLIAAYSSDSSREAF